MIRLPDESEPAVVVEGDCLDVLPMIDPSAIAAVITDPPYGVGLTIHRNRTGARLAERYETIRNDDLQEMGAAVLEWATAKNLPTVAFADPMRPWPGEWRQHLAWDKGAGVGGLGDYRRTWKRTWELVQVARNGALLGRRDAAVLRFPVRPGTKAHHAEKSVDLMRYLIRQLVPPGGLILDPFAGVGSTAVAAVMEGRRCLSVEIAPKYAAIARRRIAAARAESPLYAGV